MDGPQPLLKTWRHLAENRLPFKNCKKEKNMIVSKSYTLVNLDCWVNTIMLVLSLQLKPTLCFHWPCWMLSFIRTGATAPANCSPDWSLGVDSYYSLVTTMIVLAARRPISLTSVSAKGQKSNPERKARLPRGPIKSEVVVSLKRLVCPDISLTTKTLWKD